MSRILGNWRPLHGLVLPLAILAVAQIAAMVAHLQSNSIASPSDVGIALVAGLVDGSIEHATLETLTATLAGLAIGSMIGISLGIVSRPFPRRRSIDGIHDRNVAPKIQP